MSNAGAFFHQLLRHGLGVAGHKVVLGGQHGHLAHGGVQPAHDGGKLVAVRASHAQEHVHARALELAGGYRVQPHHAPGVVPARLDAQGMQGLAFHDALVAHGFARPQGEGDFLGPLAVVLFAVLGHPGIERGHAGVPGLTCGHAAGVETVQIAASGQAFGVAHGVATVAGSKVFAIQRGQKAFDFFVVRQRGIELLGAQGQRQQHRGLQHFGLGPVGHRAACQVHGSLRVHRAQVQAAGGLRIFQGHLQPARRARLHELGGVQQKHLVNVFTQRVDQGFAQGLQHGEQAALGAGHLAKGGQAQGLGGLGQFVQVGVQQLHEAGKVGADFVLRPAQVAVVLLLDKMVDQTAFQLHFGGAGSHGFPVVHQVMHLVRLGSKTSR